MIEEGRALFLQIAEGIEDSILDGSLPEETRAPSTNELAAFYRINPATAAKGVGLLVDKGVIYKQRGIGMFVATGARAAVLAERRAAFADRFVDPLLAEARSLGLGPDELAVLVRDRAASVSGAAAAPPSGGPTSAVGVTTANAAPLIPAATAAPTSPATPFPTPTPSQTTPDSFGGAR